MDGLRVTHIGGPTVLLEADAFGPEHDRFSPDDIRHRLMKFGAMDHHNQRVAARFFSFVQRRG